MLINFSTTNFRSFKDISFLSLNETNETDYAPQRFTYSGRQKIGYISHLCGIFGANAAGKSGIISAMEFARHLIVSSATAYTQDEELYHAPHKFDNELASAPTEFEFTLKLKNSVFRYGFTQNSQKIVDEWLYETPLEKNKRQRVWFTREGNIEAEGYDWNINDAYISNGNRLKSSTRNNALFLSSAVRDNSAELLDLFSWFKTKLLFIGTNERIASDATAKEIHKGVNHDKIVRLLTNAGIKVSSIEVDEEDFDETAAFPQSMPSELKNFIIKKMKGGKTYNTKFLHHTRSGSLVELDLEDQSDGTQVLFSLAWPLLDVLESPATLIVDELHNNLHPHLMRQIVSMFNKQKDTGDAAQLIFTSHDTHVMNPNIMSDEQIWFVEKNEYGESQTFPLSDVTNKRSLNYSKSYLSGRYGAVPEITKAFN